MGEIMALQSSAMVPNILLVDDSDEDAALVEVRLNRELIEGCNITRAITLHEALDALNHEEYDIVLLDFSLPDTKDFDGLLSIQSLAPKVPVIMLTANSDDEFALQAVECGAQDYLIKGKADGEAIHRAMQYAVRRKQFEDTLIRQANFDMLTGLANRTLFESRVDMALARMRRSNLGIGLFFLDLNRFKAVNDTLGHAAGDVILKQVAERLKQSLRPYDTAARFGGDEFAVLVEGIARLRDFGAIATKIAERMNSPFSVESREVEIGVSIGIATCFIGDEFDRNTLMQQADKAMYSAKLAPETPYHFYTPEIHAQALQRLKMEEELRLAIATDQLTLHYQPKVNLKTGKTTGAEALVRWNHPERGIMLPGEFMSVAHDTGLINELGNWVLDMVCSDITRWKEAGLPVIKISINLSAQQLDDMLLADTFRLTLEEHNVPAIMVAVEVPSSALLERTQMRVKALASLHDIGIAVHLDHFGTSAISLAPFESFCVDAVKIGPELIRSLEQPGEMLTLVQAVMDIAARFDVDIVAAGIENEWQRAFFRDRNCKEGQGFCLGRPMPVEQMPDWLSSTPSG